MTTQSTPNVSVTDQQMVQAQVVDYLADFVQNDFKEFYIEDRQISPNPVEFLINKIDSIKALFHKLCTLTPRYTEYLNTAVSCYLIHSTNDPNTKDKAVSAMNKVIETSICLAKYSEEISYFNSLLHNIGDLVEERQSQGKSSQSPLTPYDEIQNRINETDAIITKLEQK